VNAKAANAARSERETEGLYGMPGHLIRRCHQISVALFHEECAAFGITPQQYAALRMLASHDGVDQITLAGLVAFNRSTVGDVVALLETAGMLKRQDGSDDRRVKNLFITKAGRQRIKDVEAGVRRVQERLLEPLDKKERALFIEFLARIASVNNELSRAPLRPARKGKTQAGDALRVPIAAAQDSPKSRGRPT
jgi:DNA-binding MarR family transcriptional regulator